MELPPEALWTRLQMDCLDAGSTGASRSGAEHVRQHSDDDTSESIYLASTYHLAPHR